MAYKITGRVLMLTPLQTFKSKTGAPFVKRDLVITVRLFDRYTGEPTDDMENTPKFSFVGDDKCNALNPIKTGDIVTVEFDINGRSYNKDGNTEYMTDVRPFRVYPSMQNAVIPQKQAQVQQSATTPIPGQPTAYLGATPQFSQNISQSHPEAPFPQNMQRDFPGAPLPGDEFR